MPDQRTLGDHAVAPVAAKRKPYVAPKVEVLGRLDDLTLGPAGSTTDAGTKNRSLGN